MSTKKEFHSKRDLPFSLVIFAIVIILFSVFFIPLLMDETKTALDVSIVMLLASMSTGIILWCFFDISYELREGYLFVKGGFFRSKIPYKEITKVAETSDFYTGYKILSSTQAIEISYKSATLGSVKISPEDKEGFIEELEKRCPHLSNHKSIIK
ncbi:PH domain-containing protein [Rossellomorea aquimaris]|uniref:PH domain-containing protein n=1 Tax=Rossellomorea aquimaris TaxID=189382 RepID=UPI001CD1FF66|nr:PH domain-containing protein [Rossellomorea aquimaris]MCA1055817.1 PH domain-containing protein [Rossellomorea aquimaris]